jgi:two-component system phosphate regulon sensor histidine kinase PhoR
MRHLFALEIDQTLSILGAPGELYSAFSNLVLNAQRYTGEGGVIRIRWYRDAAGAHLAVSDTGIGIPAHHLPRLCERFYRVDQGRSRDSGGTGLGLAIVKHVLKRHRAELHIESTLGQGSVFRCDFPPDLIVAPEPAADLGHGA